MEQAPGTTHATHVNGLLVHVTRTRHGGYWHHLGERPPWWSLLEWWRYRWNCWWVRRDSLARPATRAYRRYWRADDAQAAAYARALREAEDRPCTYTAPPHTPTSATPTKKTTPEGKEV